MVLVVGHVTDLIIESVLVDCVTVAVAVTVFGLGNITVLDGNKGF